MIDSLGDVGAALSGTSSEKLYKAAQLDMWFDHEKEVVDATTSLRVNNACVRGHSYALSTRLILG